MVNRFEIDESNLGRIIPNNFGKFETGDSVKYFDKDEKKWLRTFVYNRNGGINNYRYILARHKNYRTFFNVAEDGLFSIKMVLFEKTDCELPPLRIYE